MPTFPSHSRKQQNSCFYLQSSGALCSPAMDRWPGGTEQGNENTPQLMGSFQGPIAEGIQEVRPLLSPMTLSVNSSKKEKKKGKI